MMRVTKKKPVRISIAMQEEKPISPAYRLERAITFLTEEVDEVKTSDEPISKEETKVLFHRFKQLAAAIDQLGDKLSPPDERPEGDVVSDWRFGDNCFSD